jgi:hypothetical protein
MAWVDLLVTSLASSAFVGVVLAVGAALSKPAYEGWLQRRFNGSLEKLKACLRQDEERLKAELQAQQKQIETLQQSVLGGISRRNELLESRRLQATEKLWAAVIELNPQLTAAQMSKSLFLDKIIDVAAKRDAEGEKMRVFVAMITKSWPLDDFLKPSGSPIDKGRIFVAPEIWTLFSLYRQVLLYIVAQWMAARDGLGHDLVSRNPKELFDAVKAAVPYMSAFIDEYRAHGLAYVAESLQDKLLKQIMLELEGEESDRKMINRAADLARLARSAVRDQPQPPAEFAAVKAPEIVPPSAPD